MDEEWRSDAQQRNRERAEVQDKKLRTLLGATQNNRTDT